MTTPVQTECANIANSDCYAHSQTPWSKPEEIANLKQVKQINIFNNVFIWGFFFSIYRSNWFTFLIPWSF